MPDEAVMPPVHPGEVLLAEYLESLELSQYQLVGADVCPEREEGLV